MIIGLDEVGRGSLAGPVVVGAVILEDNQAAQDCLRHQLEELIHCHLTDSKHLSSKRRQLVFDFLSPKPLWSIGVASVDEIESIGLNPSITLSAGRAIEPLLHVDRVSPHTAIADAGLFHPYEDTILTERFVRADETYLPVMLASIMAKVWRDGFMTELSISHPQYFWAQNVGYGTLAHREAITRYGLTPHHRKSFCATLKHRKP